MFHKVRLRDVSVVPPYKISDNLAEVILEDLRSRFIDTYIPGVGLVLEILNVKSQGIARIPPTSSSLHIEVEFDVLAYLPRVQEIVEGPITHVESFGVFVRVGPFDGMVHISQLADDYFSYSDGMLTGRKTGITFRRNDLIRARVISVSKPQKIFPEKVGEITEEEERAFMKIILTCRQPGLGRIKEETEGEAESV